MARWRGYRATVRRGEVAQGGAARPNSKRGRRPAVVWLGRVAAARVERGVKARLVACCRAVQAPTRPRSEALRSARARSGRGHSKARAERSEARAQRGIGVPWVGAASSASRRGARRMLMR